MQSYPEEDYFGESPEYNLTHHGKTVASSTSTSVRALGKVRVNSSAKMIAKWKIRIWNIEKSLKLGLLNDNDTLQQCICVIANNRGMFLYKKGNGYYSHQTQTTIAYGTMITLILDLVDHVFMIQVDDSEVKILSKISDDKTNYRFMAVLANSWISMIDFSTE